MAKALRDAGRGDEVLAIPDDLSCGPIASGDVAERVEWWAKFYDRAEVASGLSRFWDRLDGTDADIVLWYGRHSAAELAFYHACAERLSDRPFTTVNVTGLGPRGSAGDPASSAGRVSIMQPIALRSLFGREVSVSPKEREEASGRWRQLRNENAPFRVATPEGLISAPLEYFDRKVLAFAGRQPKQVSALVFEAAFGGDAPYHQTGDVMLMERIASLVESGALASDRDPDDIRSGRVWKPA